MGTAAKASAPLERDDVLDGVANCLNAFIALQAECPIHANQVSTNFLALCVN